PLGDANHTAVNKLGGVGDGNESEPGDPLAFSDRCAERQRHVLCRWRGVKQLSGDGQVVRRALGRVHREIERRAGDTHTFCDGLKTHAWTPGPRKRGVTTAKNYVAASTAFDAGEVRERGAAIRWCRESPRSVFLELARR